jgi:hypothetical protein
MDGAFIEVLVTATCLLRSYLFSHPDVTGDPFGK